MAIETHSELQSSYVHYFCKGPFEFEAIKDVFSTAFEIASEKNRNAILVDIIELHGKPPTTYERFNLGEYVAHLCFKFGKPVRIAVVGKIPIVDPERFGETVAVNRGANGKVFTELEEAKDWLK